MVLLSLNSQQVLTLVEQVENAEQEGTEVNGPGLVRLQPINLRAPDLPLKA